MVRSPPSSPTSSPSPASPPPAPLCSLLRDPVSSLPGRSPPAATSVCASPMYSRKRRRPSSLYPATLPGSSRILWLLVLWGCLANSVAAVLISSFDNCLSQSIKDSPSHMQFWPILVATSFREQCAGCDEHVLDVTVWGTVTGLDEGNPEGTSAGSRRRDLLGVEDNDGRPRGLRRDADPWRQAPWRRDVEDSVGLAMETRGLNGTVTEDPYASPTYFDKINAKPLFPPSSFNTTGMIVDEDLDAWGQNVATTLKTSVKVASINVVNNNTYFCHTSNGTVAHNTSAYAQCPFGATDIPNDDRNNVAVLTENLHNFTWSYVVDSGYSFSTLEVTMTILSGDKSSTHVGCIHAEITPILGSSYSELLTWLSAAILFVAGVATIVGAMFNPWTGNTDIFRWSCNWGMDEDMIRLVTPGFADCLQWLQFAALSGGLNLNYPGFYQPVVSKAAWSALLVNTSFWSQDPVSGSKWVADGVYAVEAWKHGYERLAQLTGLATTNDIWVCVAVWFFILLVGSAVVSQAWLWGKWLVKKAIGVEQVDLTNKSWPFSAGLMLRMGFTWFLVPVLTASFFRLTVTTDEDNTMYVILSAVLIVIFLAVAGLITYMIWVVNPRQRLFDSQSTLLYYGTFYNTFREKSVSYFPFPLGINILRSVAFGALQPSGIAQITILAASEVVAILSVWGAKPYPYHTSMNVYHVILAFMRLLIIMIMMTFIPSIDASDAARAWAGWIILGLHAVILVFAFFLRSAQTLLEISIRSLRRDVNDAERGGLTQVFGLRQLAARKRSETARSSSATTLTLPNSSSDRKPLASSSRRPHSRSNSSAILLGSPTSDPGMLTGSHHANSNSGSYTPTTPGGSYGYGFPAGPMSAGGLTLDTAAAASGPYYRAPRTRRHGGSGSEGYSPAARSRGSWASEFLARGGGRSSQGSLGVSGLANQVDDWDESAPGPSAGRGSTPSGHRHTESAATGGSHRGNTDYAVREVDFYYGVRGPALSNQPARRLGTGPADPTGPVSVAKSWLKTKLGLVKSKEEHGFSVVRSARAPEALLDARREAGIPPSDPDEDQDPQIGVAVTSADRASPASDSDSDNDDNVSATSHMLDGQDEEQEGGAAVGVGGAVGGIELVEPGRVSRKPTVPRKSSKRKSRELSKTQSLLADPEPASPTETSRLMRYDTDRAGREGDLGSPTTPTQASLSTGATNRLPFERKGSRGHGKEDSHSRSISTTSSMLHPPPEIGDEGGARPASVGEVNRYRVGDQVHHLDGMASVRGSQAELVRGGSGGSRVSVKSRRESAGGPAEGGLGEAL